MLFERGGAESPRLIRSRREIGLCSGSFDIPVELAVEIVCTVADVASVMRIGTQKMVR